MGFKNEIWPFADKIVRKYRVLKPVKEIKINARNVKKSVKDY